MNPCPHTPPLPMADAHHPGLVAAALRVGGGVDERGDPVALVVAEDGGRQRDDDDRHRQDGGGDEPAPWRPGHRDDDGPHREDDGRRPEVGLEQDQPDREGDEGRRDEDLTRPRCPPPVGRSRQQGREDDAEPDLEELGRLEREAPDERDPRARPVDGQARPA